MSISINTNTSAISAAYNLNQSNAKLQQALAELSSGSKIVNPSDDAGGLAVSMKMNSTITNTNAASTNVANAQSFLTTQDGSLNVASSIMTRISELKTMSTDPTKSASDVSNYNAEFNQLQTQLTDLSAGSFNGVALFGNSSASQLTVGISADGVLTQGVAQAYLSGAASTIVGFTSGSSFTGGTSSSYSQGLTVSGLADVSATAITSALQTIATMAATNGAQSSGLSFASQTLSASSTNLQAAKGQITDVDVAAESTELAKDNVLVQAGASMLSQANSSSQIALKLLQ